MPSLLETVLYAPDPPACAAWYASVIGLTPFREPSPTGAALRIAPGSVLLIFDPAHAAKPGRGVPTHGWPASGGPGQPVGHVAFRVDDLDQWRERLTAKGVEIEQEAEWSPPDFREGRSIYCRDPAGNSVELVNADIWPGGTGC